MVSDGMEAWVLGEVDFIQVPDPEFWHDLGTLTHWEDEPMMIGGWGVEAETFDGTNWTRQEDIPSWYDPDYGVHPKILKRLIYGKNKKKNK